MLSGNGFTLKMNCRTLVKQSTENDSYLGDIINDSVAIFSAT